MTRRKMIGWSVLTGTELVDRRSMMHQGHTLPIKRCREEHPSLLLHAGAKQSARRRWLPASAGTALRRAAVIGKRRRMERRPRRMAEVDEDGAASLPVVTSMAGRSQIRVHSEERSSAAMEARRGQRRGWGHGSTSRG